MLRNLIIITFLFTLTVKVHSADKWFLKGGITYSSFVSKGHNKTVTGKSFGLGKNWNLYKDLSLKTELLISNYGGYLNNITVKGGGWEFVAYSYDYEIKAIYIELPLLFDYGFKHDNFSANVYLGPSLKLGVGYDYKRSNRELVYDSSNPDPDYNFEYTIVDRDALWAPKSGPNLNAGLQLKVYMVSLDLRYCYSLHKIGGLADLDDIKYNFQSINILLGFHF